MNAALLSWWNLLFLVPFALGALLVFVSMLSLAGGHGHGAGHSHGAGHGHSVSHGHSTAHSSHHHHARAGGKAKSSAEQASLPPMLWLQNAFLCWGACGYGANLWLGFERFHQAALIIAALGGLMMTIGVGSILRKMAPLGGTAVWGRGDLEGCVGEATAPIESAVGAALVRDGNGTLHQVSCRSSERIERGAKVLLIAWDEATDCFRVRQWHDDIDAEAATQSTLGSQSTLRPVVRREEALFDERS